MIEKQQLEEIVSEFFKAAGLDASIEKINIEEETVFVKLKAEDPQILIGQNGQILRDIQFLLKSIIRKKTPDYFRLDVDINDYKERKIEYLKETAKSIADDVSLNKRERALPAMPAYERRIIHLELLERKDIRTRSIGEEPDRKILISPAD